MSFALVDANNFYASCEAVFRPDLRGRPIVVLSNNDGCIVARSAEVKAMGVKMGEPYFKIKQQLDQAGVIAFSSNYALYADMSSRMMQLLTQMTPATEIYSIDECFVDTRGISELHTLGIRWRETIEKYIGLTVGVGFGPTKTLAKLANYAAKKYPATGGVVDLSDRSRQLRLMAITPVDEIWGVGRRISSKLNKHGIHTALDLANADTDKIRKSYSVVLARTVTELNGLPCLELEAIAPTKQQIVCSRSFGRRVETFDELRAATSNYVARAAEKLRKEKRLCRGITVFVRGNPFAEKAYYSNSCSHVLTEHTNDTRDLLAVAELLLKRLYKPGEEFKKSGVMLFDFCDDYQQRSLFPSKKLKQNGALMHTLDCLNKQKHQVHFGSQIITDTWKMQRQHLSPSYTTRWEDIPHAK